MDQKQKLKLEMINFLSDISLSKKIDKTTCNEILSFSTNLLDKMYELGKLEKEKISNENIRKSREIAKENLERIKAGERFGIPDGYDYDCYFPLKFLRVIDEYNFIIEVIEKGYPKPKPYKMDTYIIFFY